VHPPLVLRLRLLLWICTRTPVLRLLLIPRELTVEPLAHETPSLTKGLYTLNTLKISNLALDTPDSDSVH
jgi:hypothetical protein